MTLQGEGEAQSSCATKPPRANFTVVAAMQLSSCCILIVGGEGGGEKGKKKEEKLENEKTTFVPNKIKLENSGPLDFIYRISLLKYH